MAPTTMEDNQTATMAPPPYISTVDLFSRPSHCTKSQQSKNNTQKSQETLFCFFWSQAMVAHLFLQICDKFVGVHGCWGLFWRSSRLHQFNLVETISCNWTGQSKFGLDSRNQTINLQFRFWNSNHWLLSWSLNLVNRTEFLNFNHYTEPTHRRISIPVRNIRFSGNLWQYTRFFGHF